MLPCIGEPDVLYTRQHVLTEVSAFLSVTMRKAERPREATAAPNAWAAPAYAVCLPLEAPQNTQTRRTARD